MISRRQLAPLRQALILAVIFSMLSAGVASGQTNCSACWTNLFLHWHGTYNLTLSGNGTTSSGCAFQVNNSLQGTIDARSTTSGAFGSIQGSGSIAVSVPSCENASCTDSGTGFPSAPDDLAIIFLDLTNCTYTILINDEVDISETVCEMGCSTGPVLRSLSGGTASGSIGTPPPYFPLPPFGEPLTVSTNYSSVAYLGCFGLIGPCTVTLSWNIQTSFDSNAPPTFTHLPTGGLLGCNPTNLPSDADVLNQVQVNAASGNSTVTAVHVDGGSLGPLCQSNRTFTITATDTCEDTQAKALVVYTWITDTTPPVFTSLPAGGSLGINPPVIPSDSNILSQVAATDDCAVILTNVTHVDGGNSIQSNRTFTITITDVCTKQATTKIVYTWTSSSGVGSPPLTAAFLSGSIIISWPTNAAGFTLQTTTNLNPPIAWTTVTDLPSIIADSYYVTNRPGDPARFYWLFK
jgi:hypothetical protein